MGSAPPSAFQPAHRALRRRVLPAGRVHQLSNCLLTIQDGAARSARPVVRDIPAGDASGRDSGPRLMRQSAHLIVLLAFYSLAARSSLGRFAIVIRFLPISIRPAVFSSLRALVTVSRYT